jgi:diadenosine tetraphosphatase ApaH/serine/threonine PP2A family protein phosphatase
LDEHERAEPEQLAAQQRRWQFLCQRPRVHREDPFLFVHGSARNPLAEYVFPEDVFNKQKLGRIFEMIHQFCFQGHTHVPGVFTAAGTFLRPDELTAGYRLGDQKVMINVGSVGQPRDGDPRSCYVVQEDDLVKFRRVPYPIQNTVAKIHAIPELDRFLGDRLLEGR